MNGEWLAVDMPARMMTAGSALTDIRVVVRYRAADPLAIEATFHLDANPGVTWAFGRELLATGLEACTGEGDVQAWPGLDEDGERKIYLALSSDEGGALIELDATAVRAFLATTNEVVPMGGEDVPEIDDDAIYAWMAGAE